jgi:hypothetical protein
MLLLWFHHNHNNKCVFITISNYERKHDNEGDHTSSSSTTWTPDRTGDGHVLTSCNELCCFPLTYWRDFTSFLTERGLDIKKLFTVIHSYFNVICCFPLTELVWSFVLFYWQEVQKNKRIFHRFLFSSDEERPHSRQHSVSPIVYKSVKTSHMIDITCLSHRVWCKSVKKYHVIVKKLCLL